MKTLEDVLKSLVDVNYTAADRDKAIGICKAVRASIINGDEQYNFKVLPQEGLTERFLWDTGKVSSAGIPIKSTTGDFYLPQSLVDDIDFFLELTYSKAKGYDYSHLRPRILRVVFQM